MIDKVRELVKRYLDEGKVDGVLAMIGRTGTWDRTSS
jgi:coenzyme F420-reducing hydrogenase beta subunit